MNTRNHRNRAGIPGGSIVNLLFLLFCFTASLIAQEEANISEIGRWGKGINNAIAVDGSRVYFNNGAYLQIVDYSDSGNPVELARLEVPSPIVAVELQGAYAYVAAHHAGLFIFDISDPSAPEAVGSYEPVFDFADIAVRGNHAFVLKRGRLDILDISNPAAPQFVGYTTGISDGKSIAIRNQSAYIADGFGGLRILDISEPQNPVQVSQFDTGRYNAPAQDIALAGDHAYLAIGYGGVISVNISDPAAPVQADSLSLHEWVAGIALSGSHAYVASGSNGLYGIDISDPTALNSAGSLDIEGFAGGGIAAVGDRVYLADDFFGLRVISVATPSEPDEEGFFETGHVSENVTIADDYAYVANGRNGMVVLDISDPAAPQDIGHLSSPGLVEDIAVSGDYAYQAANYAGLRIVDISDPANPLTVSFFDVARYGSGNTRGSAKRVLVRGNYAYVAAGYPGLIIVDISDPANPSEAARYGFPPVAWDIDISGDHIFIGAALDGLAIVDISNPLQPKQAVLIDSIKVDDVIVSGQYAYVFGRVSGKQKGLFILDISDPAAPQNVGFLAVKGQIMDIRIIGSYAYLADLYSGMHIIDISDPAKPEKAGFYETYTTGRGLADHAGTLYLAEGWGGVRILQHDRTTSVAHKHRPQQQFRLAQNYPNPFNPGTTITFELPRAGRVTLKIFDSRGREVRTLLDEHRPSGVHRVVFTARDLASGVYFYKITAGNFSRTEKMLLMR